MASMRRRFADSKSALRLAFRSRGPDTDDEPPPPYAPSAHIITDATETREITENSEPAAPTKRTQCVMSANINTGILVPDTLLVKCNDAGCLFCNLLLFATRMVSRATDRLIRVDFSNEKSPILRMQIHTPAPNQNSAALYGRWEIYQSMSGMV
jgi:hypothetical protein